MFAGEGGGGGKGEGSGLRGDPGVSGAWVEGMDGVVDVGLEGGTVGVLEVHLDMHLHGGGQGRDKEEDGAAVGGEVSGLDVEAVAAFVAIGFEVRRAVVFGPAVVPGLDVVVAGVGGGGGVEGLEKAEDEAIGDGEDIAGELEGMLGAADAVEAPGLGFVASPAVEAAGVEVAVAGVEACAHDAGVELEGEWGDSALEGGADPLGGDEEDAADAVRETEEAVVEGGPGGGVDPGEGAGGAVDAGVDPGYREFVGRLAAVWEPSPVVAVEGIGAEEVDAVGGEPVTFLISGIGVAARGDEEPVGGAVAVGEGFGAGAVGGDFEEGAVVGMEGFAGVAGGFHVIEIAVAVGLEVEGEFVEVLGGHGVVVEALVEIGFAVAVEVVEAGDLVASQDVDLVVDNSEAEGLEETGGDALPGEAMGGVIEAMDGPDVAAPGAEGGASGVGEEVEAAEPHPGVPGVVVWPREGIDGEGAVFGTGLGVRGDGGGPARGASLGQRGEVEGGGSGGEVAGEGRELGGGKGAEPEGEVEGGVVWREGQTELAFGGGFPAAVGGGAVDAGGEAFDAGLDVGEGGDFLRAEGASVEAEFVEGALKVGVFREVGGGEAELEDFVGEGWAGGVGGGAVGGAVDVEGDGSGLVRPSHGDVAPLVGGEGLAGGDGADPADVEGEASAAEEEGFAVGDPGTSGQGLGEQRAVAGGFDPAGGGEVGGEQVDLGVGTDGAEAIVIEMESLAAIAWQPAVLLEGKGVGAGGVGGWVGLGGVEGPMGDQVGGQWGRGSGRRRWRFGRVEDGEGGGGVWRGGGV